MTLKNNKKSLFVLIPLMLIVWGAIAYRLFFGLEPQALNQNNPIVYNTPVEIPSDTLSYSLSLNYADPFNPSVSPKKKIVAETKEVEIDPEIFKEKDIIDKVHLWPALKYGGMVTSSNQKRVGLLTINGRAHLIKSGEFYDSVEVIQYSESQVTLKYKGEEREIIKR